MEDLKEAIIIARQAVDITPKDYLDSATRSNNLGNKLESQYKRIGKIENLKEAI